MPRDTWDKPGSQPSVPLPGHRMGPGPQSRWDGGGEPVPMGRWGSSTSILPPAACRSRMVPPFPRPRHSSPGLARSLLPGFILAWSKSNTLSCHCAGGRAHFSRGDPKAGWEAGAGRRSNPPFPGSSTQGRSLSSPPPAMLRLHPRAAPANIAPPKQPPEPQPPGLSRAGPQAGRGGKGVPAARRRRGQGWQCPCQHGPHPCPGHGGDMAEAAANTGTHWHGKGRQRLGRGTAMLTSACKHWLIKHA